MVLNHVYKVKNLIMESFDNLGWFLVSETILLVICTVSCKNSFPVKMCWSPCCPITTLKTLNQMAKFVGSLALPVHVGLILTIFPSCSTQELDVIFSRDASWDCSTPWKKLVCLCPQDNLPVKPSVSTSSWKLQVQNPPRAELTSSISLAGALLCLPLLGRANLCLEWLPSFPPQGFSS